MKKMSKKILIVFLIILIILIYPFYKTFSNNYENSELILNYFAKFENQIDKKYKFSETEVGFYKEYLSGDYKYFIKANEAFLEKKKTFSIKLKKGFIKSYKNNQPFFFAEADNVIFDNVKSPNIIYLKGNADLSLFDGKFIFHADKIIFNFENNNIYIDGEVHLLYNYNYEISGDTALVDIKNLLFKIYGNIVIDAYDYLLFSKNEIIKTKFLPIRLFCEKTSLDFKNKNYVFEKNFKLESDKLNLKADYFNVNKNNFYFTNVDLTYMDNNSNQIKIKSIRTSILNQSNTSDIELIDGSFFYKKNSFILTNSGKYTKFELKFFNDKIILYKYNFIKSSMKIEKNNFLLDFSGDNGKYNNDFKDQYIYLKNGNIKYENSNLKYLSSGNDLNIVINNLKIINKFKLSFNYYKDKNKEIYFESKKGKFSNEKSLILNDNVRYKDYKSRIAISSDYFKEIYNKNNFISKNYVNFYYFDNKINPDWHFSTENKNKYNISIFAKCNKLIYNNNRKELEFKKIINFENLKDKYRLDRGDLIWNKDKNYFMLKEIKNFNSEFIKQYLNNLNFSYAILKDEGKVLSSIKDLRITFGKRSNYSIKINNGNFNLIDGFMIFGEFNFKLLNKNLFIGGDSGKIDFKSSQILLENIYNFRVNGERIVTDEIKINFDRNIINYYSKENNYSMDIE